MGNRVDKNSKKKKKKSKLKVIVIPVLIVFLLFGIGFTGVLYYLNKFKYNDMDTSKLSINNVNKVDIGKDNNSRHTVKNILLLGVDNQEKASDSIIILSLDDTTKQMKMTSIMRDTYIEFGPGKVNKINYAYHYGGPELTIKTLNEKLKLDISDYVLVDFKGLTKIVNEVGGIEVEVTPEEVDLLNSYAKNISSIDRTQYTPIKRSGKQLLNGQQTTAYCRIRYVGNGDYQRTERQRTVLTDIFTKLKDLPISDYPRVINDISPYIQTTLNNFDTIKLASQIATYGKNGIKTSRLPYDGYHHDDTKGTFYLRWDEEPNLKLLHEFIYFN